MKKHFKAVELKYLDDATIMKIREWRNKPFVRNMMFSQHEITEEEHRDYIAALKQDDSRGLFVFYLDDEPFGVFQYKLISDEYALIPGTYLIDEKYQLLGYGCILDYMMYWIVSNYLNVNVIKSEMLEVNRDQIKMQKKDPRKTITIQHKIVNGIEKNIYYCQCIVDKPDENSRLGKLVMQIIERDSLEIRL